MTQTDQERQAIEELKNTFRSMLENDKNLAVTCAALLRRIEVIEKSLAAISMFMVHVDQMNAERAMQFVIDHPEKLHRCPFFLKGVWENPSGQGNTEQSESNPN